MWLLETKMSLSTRALAATLLSSVAGLANAQVVLTGRLTAPEYPGAEQTVPMTAVHCFANLPGSWNQAVAFRTWETHPAGWYYLPGSPGRYSVIFADPAGFVRPLALTNIYTAAGEKVGRDLTPRFDYADFTQGAWDEKPAAGYYQTFVAVGTSITQVGFKLATDGVDGPGPLGQNLLVSIHRKTDGAPETWPQVGLVACVLDVDCGGPKNYWWSAGWDSGKVPTTPGLTYAVHLRAESAGGRLQAFWRAASYPQVDCYRVDPAGKGGFVGRNLCMTVGSDCDGLVIPYNKCVHKKFGEFGGFDRTWSQTWAPQGRSLASVILYAATSGVQPSMNRQRVRVRVRVDGPDGEVVGVEKIATGNANYTGDASWGVFGVSFAPGEVVLEPGRTYAVEFESIESYVTLHGYVNIKGMVSDDKPGFNPYRKHPRDGYAAGTAYRGGTARQDFDLDMQIAEYEHEGAGWADAVVGENLIANGDMQQARPGAAGPNDLMPAAWEAFRIDPATGLRLVAEPPQGVDFMARVFGGSSTGNSADGGFVQVVGGLRAVDTYRLAGRLRTTWPVDEKHVAMIGYDPTGQTTDPTAATISWTLLPAVSGLFVDHTSEPIRPKTDRISVWLRARTTQNDDYRFEADFDHLTLHQIPTTPPTP